MVPKVSRYVLLVKVMEDEFNAVPDDDGMQTIELADRGASQRKIADIERDDAGDAISDSSSEEEAHV